MVIKLDANHIHFHYRKDSAGNALSMFEPHTPNSKPGDYYWLGDGVFDHAMDSTTYIFAYSDYDVCLVAFILLMILAWA